jgi:hypothetical protein
LTHIAFRHDGGIPQPEQAGHLHRYARIRARHLDQELATTIFTALPMLAISIASIRAHSKGP